MSEPLIIYQSVFLQSKPSALTWGPVKHKKDECLRAGFCDFTSRELRLWREARVKISSGIWSVFMWLGTVWGMPYSIIVPEFISGLSTHHDSPYSYHSSHFAVATMVSHSSTLSARLTTQAALFLESNTIHICGYFKWLWILNYHVCTHHVCEVCVHFFFFFYLATQFTVLATLWRLSLQFSADYSLSSLGWCCLLRLQCPQMSSSLPLQTTEMEPKHTLLRQPAGTLCIVSISYFLFLI